MNSNLLATHLFPSSFSTRLQSTPRVTTTRSKCQSAWPPFPFSISEDPCRTPPSLSSCPSSWGLDWGLGKCTTSRDAITPRPPHAATWKQPTALSFVRFMSTWWTMIQPTIQPLRNLNNFIANYWRKRNVCACDQNFSCFWESPDKSFTHIKQIY